MPEVTGWLVPPRDPAALTTAINEVLSLGADEREQLGGRARAHIATNFTREAMCARTIEVYEELLARDRHEISRLVVAGASPTA